MVPVEWMQIPGDFYPRSPCGERRDARAAMKRAGMISIHALLAESDGQCPPYHGDSLQFLSTLSLRRATVNGIAVKSLLANFYPRSPCGERQRFIGASYGRTAFLSTLSLRRATGHPAPCRSAPSISIHALLAESDVQDLLTVDDHSISIHALLAESDYLSWAFLTRFKRFLSTLSLRRATWSTPPCKRFPYNFYPRSPCGERRR